MIRFWQLVVIISALCCFANRSFATTVLAFRTNGQLVVAADSKVVSVNSDGLEARTCKILITPNHIFAAAGIMKETVGPFNIYETARKILSTEKDHKSIIAAYEKEMTNAIPPILTEIRNQSQRYFETKVRGNDAFQALFATAEEGIVKVSSISFHVADIGDISVRRRTCPDTCDTVHPLFIALGEHETADAEVSKDPTIWSKMGVVGALSELIRLQTIAKPETVGGPTSIAVILSNGQVGWNQPGQCAQESRQ